MPYLLDLEQNVLKLVDRYNSQTHLGEQFLPVTADWVASLLSFCNRDEGCVPLAEQTLDNSEPRHLAEVYQEIR